MSNSLRELRRLNFQDLIEVRVPDVEAYTFAEYKRAGSRHSPIGYCISCEKEGCNVAKDNDPSYRLTNISHGAHSSDFFLAMKDAPDTSNWNDYPVFFVYEGPSRDYGIYAEVEYKEIYRKRPSKDWYWIFGDLDSVSYPKNFKSQKYGEFVLSAMYTFKLSNVYITNLIKCGLNNQEGNYKSLPEYKEETINNCYSNFLKRELAIFKPKIVFTIGTGVTEWVAKLSGNAYLTHQLPHPAARGIRDEYFKAIYFWGVAQGLYKAGMIDSAKCCELAKLYLEKYDEVNI